MFGDLHLVNKYLRSTSYLLSDRNAIMGVGARREQLIHKDVVPVQGPGLGRAGRGVRCAQRNHLILTGGQGKASRRGDVQDGCPVKSTLEGGKR